MTLFDEISKKFAYSTSCRKFEIDIAWGNLSQVTPANLR